MGLITFDAAHVINFIDIVEQYGAPGKPKLPPVDNAPHVNAFGDYARIVSRLASVFVPDMTIGSSDLNVEIVETSLCLTPDELPGMPSTNRREMDWTVDDPIVVRGWKTAWESEEGEEENEDAAVPEMTNPIPMTMTPTQPNTQQIEEEEEAEADAEAYLPQAAVVLTAPEEDTFLFTQA